MDARATMLRLMRKEFGHLKNSARLKVVTVTAVNLGTFLATVQLAQGDPLDPIPDEQDVGFLDSYTPQVNDLAYMLLGEGAPVLIGLKEVEDWHNLSLPTGYSVVAGWTAPAYRKDNQGRVWFRGACNIAASNAAGNKFLLPTGYRPGQSRAVAVPYSNGTVISDHIRFNIDSSGNVASGAVTPAATIFAIFEGVSFDVRN